MFLRIDTNMNLSLMKDKKKKDNNRSYRRSLGRLENVSVFIHSALCGKSMSNCGNCVKSL